MSRSQDARLFVHQPLQSSRSIRVFTLLPALERSQPLVGNLREIRLDLSLVPQPSYEALSYVWGALRGSCPLECDGKQLPITPSCDAALRHLRYLNQARVLWVDAICIDQTEQAEASQERSMQVELMGEVYANASCTFCWLGEGQSFTPRMMELLEEIAACPSQRGLRKLRRMDGECCSPISIKLKLGLVQLRQIGSIGAGSTCLEHIFCHPWHSRIWTIQEVAYSPSCYIMCGHTTISWSSYVKVAKFLLFEENIDELDLQATDNYLGIDVRETLRFYISPSQDSNTVGNKDEMAMKHSFLESCLTHIRHLQATKAKDRIYGLYSSLSALGVPLPLPDYNKSLVQIFQEATLSMISFSRSLGILSHASSNARDSSFPSWVPDWRDRDVRLMTVDSDATEGSNPRETQPFLLSPVPGHLYVWGKIFGDVTVRSQGDFSTLDISPDTRAGGLPILSGEDYKFSFDIDELRLLISQICAFREWYNMVKAAKMFYGDDPLNIFYSLLCFEKDLCSYDTFTLFVDLLNYPTTACDLSEGEKLAEEWKAADTVNSASWTTDLMHCAIIAASVASQSILKNRNTVQQAAELLPLLVDLAGNMGDRALLFIDCVSSFHKLAATVGSAFHSTRVNDVVALLEGSDTPMVLRKHAQQWQLIGPAFVPGIMDGEAWSNVNGATGELENFVLV